MSTYPETIPLENLDSFGRTDRSIAVWWSPWYGGNVSVVILRREITDPEHRDSILAKISARCPLDEVVRALVFGTWEVKVDTFEFETRSARIPTHPGQDFLERLRDAVADKLGWL